ncbi:MAG: OsmC family protein, partial [Rudaea sp.]
MRISARVENAVGRHEAAVKTGENARSLVIPPKASGGGSSVNGGELLFLALATCYCNDVYREAAKKGIDISEVVVEVEGEFGAEGEPGRDISYTARVTWTANEETVRELLEA